MTKLDRRYDFVLVFDVRDGNPNGDPDAGNLPRVDPETGHGIVTDVCLKRKIRNYVQVVKGLEERYGIYVREKAVLGRAHFEAFKKLGITTGEESSKRISKEEADSLGTLPLPDGLRLEVNEDGTGQLVAEADADVKEIKTWIKEEKLNKTIKAPIESLLKDIKSIKPKGEDVERGRQQMCLDYYDIRTFGAVMSLKSAPNCGQVRGPVQMTFGRSCDPVVPLEHSITRMAVATEAEAEKQKGDNRTMGRKHTIPYGVYVAYGFVSPHLAEQTGFDVQDLELLWEGLQNMFEVDRSAARGMMSTRGLIVFEHQSALGNAHAHALFDRVRLERVNPEVPARSFGDYTLSIDASGLAEQGVTLRQVL